MHRVYCPLLFPVRLCFLEASARVPPRVSFQRLSLKPFFLPPKASIMASFRRPAMGGHSPWRVAWHKLRGFFHDWNSEKRKNARVLVGTVLIAGTLWSCGKRIPGGYVGFLQYRDGMSRQLTMHVHHSAYNPADCIYSCTLHICLCISGLCPRSRFPVKRPSCIYVCICLPVSERILGSSDF